MPAAHHTVPHNHNDHNHNVHNYHHDNPNLYRVWPGLLVQKPGGMLFGVVLWWRRRMLHKVRWNCSGIVQWSGVISMQQLR
jgi:hypothetical protein